MFLIETKSSLRTYGYLYEHEFNPYDSIDNSLARNHDSCGDLQFEIAAYLKFNITYILIIAAHYAYANQQGPFSVLVEGSHEIKIKQMSM